MAIAIVIPARYSSTRLPGKPLIEVQGKPIIQWVYEKALQVKSAQEVIVATDDERIFNAVNSFGGKAEMTSAVHQSGSDRIAEVADNHENFDIIVNVQGDEPLITPESIETAINALQNDSNADISTLIREISSRDEIDNPNVVKAVIDNDFNALYFSRAAVPYERNSGQAKFYAHIGLYGYRRESLFRMRKLEQTSYEKAESLEQLRALQNGMKIKAIPVDYKPIGIDTSQDVEDFKAFLENSIY